MSKPRPVLHSKPRPRPVHHAINHGAKLAQDRHVLSVAGLVCCVPQHILNTSAVKRYHTKITVNLSDCVQFLSRVSSV